jgi:hypothetical protein
MPRGNGLLGDQRQEVLALFRSLDPGLRRHVMSRAVGTHPGSDQLIAVDAGLDVGGGGERCCETRLIHPAPRRDDGYVRIMHAEKNEG